ncbi:hypothetical protein GXB81_04340 [Paraburkholderia sp. Ac-20336]|uniref:hypothetical protein n=1 Tax=unclassified Paraburkholderia TaxID=2615204 RepID=UPI00141D83DD|nr:MULTISPECIES: hypothetical protein [unclassified Paraburkholderia]MBN3802286.1 hypothetical protein [Paraburkholderia sp. Ac-20336]MBN3845837.1 hypothetical protein [Paraburkholderia sp. Ac-20342]NIF77387.1 hypothetical protein [Paraburkholderia sp. Cy-641]
MNCQQIEQDIRHLEHVIFRLSVLDSIPLSLSYWRNRVEAMQTVELIPAQTLRVKRIRAAIGEIDERIGTASSELCSNG